MLSFELLNGALTPPSGEKNKFFFAKISNFKGSSFQILPLVERSHLYARVHLDEYYQNIIVTHLDHFWNLTPGPLDGFSGCEHIWIHNILIQFFVLMSCLNDFKFILLTVLEYVRTITSLLQNILPNIHFLTWTNFSQCVSDSRLDFPCAIN